MRTFLVKLREGISGPPKKVLARLMCCYKRKGLDANVRKSLVRLSDELLRTYSDNETSCRYNSVLVDGMWDNPNYWQRLTVVRRGLRLTKSQETGIIGKYSRERVRGIFRIFGVRRYWDVEKSANLLRDTGEARRMLEGVECADDFMKLRLPLGFPSQLVYDEILKRQRAGVLDINDRRLPSYVATAVACIRSAERYFAGHDISLVILSHALGYTYGSIAWAAIKKGIPVVVLYGDFGHSKFIKLSSESDIFRYPERPEAIDMETIGEDQKEKLERVGLQQINARISGKTNDTGSIYAYQKRIESVDSTIICEKYGWDTSKPIVGVYCSNWYDFPHASGLTEFRDFVDWTESTMEVAKEVKDVNWLFKAHPCDDWYGRINGKKLIDMVGEIDSDNIQLADKSWNGKELISSLTGVVTCHGTIGMEATVMEKPVLVPYQGWYGHAGFVQVAKSKKEYFELLRTNWWEGMSKKENKRLASEFAGWQYCIPDWYGNCIFKDDAEQDNIYSELESFLEINSSSLIKESEEVALWMDSSDDAYFHVYTMKKAFDYRVSIR